MGHVPAPVLHRLWPMINVGLAFSYISCGNNTYRI